MKVFAIIVTYNGMRWIDRCLQSLRQSTVPVTPIVIDNGSTDETRQHVPTNYPEVTWMPQEKNLGFGKANNLGIRYAINNGADYVLLLNQDGSLKEDAMEQMLKASDGESLVAPLQLNGTGDAFDYMFDVGLRNQHSTLCEDLLIRKTLADSYEIGEVCAACWLMPLELIKKLGGFNPFFFHYSEDNNYYHRMVYHKVKLLLAPKAEMYHDREIWGNIGAYKRNLVRRELILRACNINHKYAKSLFMSLTYVKSCYASLLPKHQYIPGTFTIDFIWLLSKAYKIYKARECDKRTGLHWI